MTLHFPWQQCHTKLVTLCLCCVETGRQIQCVCVCGSSTCWTGLAPCFDNVLSRVQSAAAGHRPAKYRRGDREAHIEGLMKLHHHSTPPVCSNAAVYKLRMGGSGTSLERNDAISASQTTAAQIQLYLLNCSVYCNVRAC